MPWFSIIEIPEPAFETVEFLLMFKAPLLFNSASFPLEFVIVPSTLKFVPLFVACNVPFSFFNAPDTFNSPPLLEIVVFPLWFIDRPEIKIPPFPSLVIVVLPFPN